MTPRNTGPAHKGDATAADDSGSSRSDEEAWGNQHSTEARAHWQRCILPFGLLALSSGAVAQVTERISLDSSGAEVPGGGDLVPPDRVISADGRYVLFFSGASALVPGDTNNTWDVFLRDRLARTTERASVDSSGAQANGRSGLYGFSMSPDARYIAFESLASNLVMPDLNGSEVFVRDLASGTTERIAVSAAGVQGNGQSSYPSVSSDGRFVAFTSNSSNLVAGDTNGKWDVFVRDRQNGTTERVSLSGAGLQGDADSYKAVITPDGRFVAFESIASNLVLGDTNARWDVFVRDLLMSTTDLVSVSWNGVLGNGDSWLAWPSNDGQVVAFTSQASNLVPGDSNATRDVFVRDRSAGGTSIVSVSVSGTAGDLASQEAVLSGDGRIVVFKSSATDLVPNGPANPGGAWIFVRDLRTRRTELASCTTDGVVPAAGFCQLPSVSSDGRYVLFESTMTTLVTGDANDYFDVFIHDRFAAGFTSLCEPGQNNVLACPCGNPASGTSRGCDNSSFTGGASLSASGNAYLSWDSLVFRTEGEKPSALSILLQGTSLVPAGAAFGQGVRCTGGVLHRLYAKSAVSGSIVAPDLQAGEPTISSRSAALGTSIHPGQPCTYMVYYRDPSVLGGCAATQTFNCTQAGSVVYWP